MGPTKAISNWNCATIFHHQTQVLLSSILLSINNIRCFSIGKWKKHLTNKAMKSEKWFNNWQGVLEVLLIVFENKKIGVDFKHPISCCLNVSRAKSDWLWNSRSSKGSFEWLPVSAHDTHILCFYCRLLRLRWCTEKVRRVYSLISRQSRLFRWHWRSPIFGCWMSFHADEITLTGARH